ncbi:MAG: cobalamin B12-binding domain-containing protein [Elusimicrobia bacterium]|nr:cobalamin B12-binding domain-containing protein [Elusimicrobiota bacterium]
MVQVNNCFSNQSYFPYSVGLLQAYAQRHLAHPDRYVFGLPIYRRVAVEQAVLRLQGSDAVFFSAYVWNIRLSLEIARRLKALRPGIITVFGGPQIPNAVEPFLRGNPCVDVACHGEGERPFLSILQQGLHGNWGDIPSISFLDEHDVLVRNDDAPRISDLANAPSPYLEGVFDPLIREHPDEQWIALWETNRGCPFSCAFCDWGSAVSSKICAFDMDRLAREVRWFAVHKIEFVFCADANFGILPRDLQIVQCVAQAKRRSGYPRALSVQNTKNPTELAFHVQRALADAKLNKGVTVSLQSLNPDTLSIVNRGNISTTSLQQMQRRFTAGGIETYTDLILGLPRETYDSFADGVSSVIANGQHNRIQFNNLVIVPNSEMGDPGYRMKYGMATTQTLIVNMHGSTQEEEICEVQELVIATDDLPRRDWARTRAFCWMTALLHFDKLLQIPLILAHEACRVPYRDLVEVFSEGGLEGCPTLSEIREFFRGKAQDIQNGGAEYCRSKEWLDIWWPADEFLFIRLIVDDRLETFYAEAERALRDFLRKRSPGLSEVLLHDAVTLNQALIKRPFQTLDLTLATGHDVLEFYHAALRGTPEAPQARPCRYRIDRTTQRWKTREDWLREVVWYGNKKGDYLYAGFVDGTKPAGLGVP